MRERDLIERFVVEHFPDASTVVVGGSTARGDRGPRSDIDLLVIGPATMFEAPRDDLAATFAFESEAVEVFAYTPETFDAWARHDVETLRPVLLSLLVEGVAVVGSRELEDLRARWAPVLAAGPELDPHALELRRYALTDLLDDLADAADPLESRVTASLVFERLAELLLLSDGRWIGNAKWLVRRLRQWDAARADALAAPLLADDIRAFASVAERELERVGGRIHTGFTR